MLKRCFKCSKNKQLSEFYPKIKDRVQDCCIVCYKKRCHNYYLKNKEKIKKQNIAYQKEHKEERSKYKLEWAHKYGKNRAQYFRERRKNYQIRLRDNLRTRLRIALYNYIDYKKFDSALNCGCSFEFLISYLESKFVADMSWNNYGSVWSIDHIKPLSKFDLTNKEQFLLANHFTNLQPLYVTENIRKGNK